MFLLSPNSHLTIIVLIKVLIVIILYDHRQNIFLNHHLLTLPLMFLHKRFSPRQMFYCPLLPLPTSPQHISSNLLSTKILYPFCHFSPCSDKYIYYSIFRIPSPPNLSLHKISVHQTLNTQSQSHSSLPSFHFILFSSLSQLPIFHI